MSQTRRLKSISWISFTILLIMAGVASLSRSQEGPPMPTQADLAALNAQMAEGGVVENLHGQDVADPFRALEADNEATWAWVDAQTAVTDSYMAAHADPARDARLAELLSIGLLDSPKSAGGRVFFNERAGDAERSVLYVLDPGTTEPRPLVDPNALGTGVTVDWFYPSPLGTYVAYGLSSGGSEQSTLHLLRTDTGEALPDTIEHTKWTALTWLPDETGFYYTRFPREGEPEYDPENIDGYWAHLFFHALGTNPASDPLFFRSPDRTYFVGGDVSATDPQYMVVSVFRGWSASDAYLFDRNQPGAPPVVLAEGQDYLTYATVHRGRVLIYSNEGHPHGRILSAPLASAGDRTTWTEVVPERDATLESWFTMGDYLVAAYVENIAGRLIVYRVDGGEVGDIPLPTAGSIDGLFADPFGNEAVFGFSSFFVPPTLYRFDVTTSTLSEVARVQTDVDVSRFELEQATVTSADGTPINVYLVHPRGITRDGTQPVLLTGYGGFSQALVPGFTRNIIHWMEQGGTYAVANIRGGSEFGEEWHQAGMLANKHHVFEDFEAVIRWFTTSGYSNPSRIGINGGSNGGLLMGAMITQCPDAFAAVVADVGLYDMVRFTEFPPAEIWMAEYGDPSQADAFAWLLDYSPYHNVVEGTAYPSILITTAEQDTRVSWRHSTKFAARLQTATSSDHPVLFTMSRTTGHGAGTSQSDLVRQFVQTYTFLETELGL